MLSEIIKRTSKNKLSRKFVKKTKKRIDKVMTHQQKVFIKGLFSPKQQEMIKKLFNPEVNHHQKRVDRLRRKLLNLGFTERAYADLQDILERSSNTYLKKLAAWELLMWHANQYTEEDARECLRLIELAVRNENDPVYLRRAVIMKAESHQQLGEVEVAKNLVSDALKEGAHADLYLARANLETTLEERIKWINKTLELYATSDVSYERSTTLHPYDGLTSLVNMKKSIEFSQPKVTVIMPVYNAEDVITTSIKSILSQTWTNLEIIVADDCSTDATVDKVEEFVKLDSRVKIVKASSNGGPYVARNLALQVATGEFVTCQDADDWSHPEKIEKQVKHLMENQAVIGNTSQQTRATNDLIFYRRGNPGFYIFNNMSSFMFRRKQVMESIGYWDCVRFGADSELIKRIKTQFGVESVVELKTGPLAFQRQSEGSLTASSAFGYHGFFMGARKEYFEVYNQYHAIANSLKYDFPQESRPFPVPEPMWPTREKEKGARRKFDVIIISDFRLDGGSTLSSVEEIKAQKRMGLRTGLVQMARYDYNPRKKVNPKIRELIDGEQVQMLVYGEEVSCDLLLVRYPPLLQVKQIYLPDIEAKELKVIVNQTPLRDYGSEVVVRFDIEQSQENLKEYFGKSGTWYPIGPLVREKLITYHAEEIKAINLSDDDWSNIIDVGEWRQSDRSKFNVKPRIGRHSRDHDVKWPDDPALLSTIYPSSPKYEIYVLGGAKTPEKTLGKLPKNWKVYEFGEVSPREFLASIDVFVYYTHQDWVESFGRVIIEAMAVGIPVILPPSYKDLFKEAAIYADPYEVQDTIEQLIQDRYYYQKQVEIALAYIDINFGYKKHALRLGFSKSD
ncbi:glycosyltransferase [Alkalihalobacillus sp. MEB130]|uniref:glycosyltransferase n=1 Tax=Alkalihalobacillus sp. MEB130 TaxID=2976704 RepID=UPI0028E01B99|nr:glycosyltransferase [Alkalihalobacillus sp. MEB130]MDT8860340.1 glycosyltransferase [Alkalihalobacillus sp. MEB130]